MQLCGNVRGTLGGRPLIEAGEYRKGLADTLGIRRNFLVVLSRLRHSQHPFVPMTRLCSLHLLSAGHLFSHFATAGSGALL